MDFNRVSHFVQVVKHGSFTMAAEELGLSKSSVSRSIAVLEKELGVRLFQRTTRRLSLTEAGQAYFEAVQHSLSVVKEASEAIRENNGEPRGTVRIAAPPPTPPAGRQARNERVGRQSGGGAPLDARRRVSTVP